MSQKKPVFFFINYRWSQCYLEARDLQHAIEETFENVKVFRDEDSIEKGESLKKSVMEALEAADQVLSLLHENWLKEPKLPEKEVLKLRSEDCWIRTELDTAHHQLGKPILPLLYGTAKLPDKEELYHLPECLHFLNSDINAHKIARDSSYKSGLDALLAVLEEKFRLNRKKSPPKPKPPCLVEQDLELPDQMPDLKEVPAPYLGIHHFEEKHARLFFGRSDDICNLWDLTERKPQRLILLYGYSGVGKSSLLHAGLFPRMKQKGWQVTAERRNKRNLAGLLAEMVGRIPATGKTLIALDQVEEALIEPSGPDPELPPLFDAVKNTLDRYPEAKILLGFRKEFLPEIRTEVKRLGLESKTGDYFLKPLSDAGVLEAIRLDEPLKAHYGFDFEAGLEEKIAACIIEKDEHLHSGEVSNKAPWLQMLLHNVWDDAEKDHKKLLDALILREANLDAWYMENFPALVKNQLSQLESAAEPHRQFSKMGLTLDLLNLLTTTNGTAAIQTDTALFERYVQGPDQLRDHLRLLEGCQLVIRFTDRKNQAHTRLAHDALAPVIRQEFEKSDKPAQRAHRIFESKKIGQGNYNAINDREDIQILTEARDYMYRWPAGAEAAFERGAEAVRKATAELRDKTAFIFDTLAGDARRLLESVDHPGALPKFEAALGVDIPLEEKQNRLQKDIEELVCFFAHTGKHSAEAQKAAGLLLEFSPDETTRAIIEKCRNANWQRKTDFTPLLDSLRYFNRDHFERRYVPKMIEVEGGIFDIGGRVEWTDPTPGQQSNPVHPVELDGFRLAETPFTFYQYALYCAATGKPVAANTPGWGRQGEAPVVYITWYDAIEIANWLSEYLGKDRVYDLDKTQRGKDEKNKTQDSYKYLTTIREGARGFRLPTEAEWEYAARGGQKSEKFLFAGSNSLDEVGWYWKNSGDQLLEGKYDFGRAQANNGRTRPVKGKNPNELELYDMSGNVWEWCWDWFDLEFYEECKADGAIKKPANNKGASSGRVLRGGSCYYFDYYCLVYFRFRIGPDVRYDDIGLRLAQD